MITIPYIPMTEYFPFLSPQFLLPMYKTPHSQMQCIQRPVFNAGLAAIRVVHDKHYPTSPLLPLQKSNFSRYQTYIKGDVTWQSTRHQQLAEKRALADSPNRMLSMTFIIPSSNSRLGRASTFPPSFLITQRTKPWATTAISRAGNEYSGALFAIS